jgi:enoyl-CoA hydratase
MPDYRKYKLLKLQREGRLLTIVMDQPETPNAWPPGRPLAPGMHQEFEALWQDIAVDDAIGAVILTGAGDRAFSGGPDMAGMARMFAGPRQVRGFVGVKRLFANMLEVEQPIIGAINGDAIGLGATLALACDLVVASERARFQDTHIRLAEPPGDGGVVLWPLMMGIHRAKEYLMTGDPLPAAEAARLGYINYAVPPEEVLPKAREIAMRLANGPTWAIRWTKTSLNKILRERLNLALDTALALEWLSLQMEDHKEAVNAFLEKRPPNFPGR